MCYRWRREQIEFLLVQTKGGRWTFPKGSAEPGLTHAQAAALEAFEEAGVHGRMEEASFATYVRHESKKSPDSKSRAKETVVSAFLCEVRRLETPPEFNRQPTWFSAEKAKRQLRDGRKPDYGAELAKVVVRAVARVRRLRPDSRASLPEVEFISNFRTPPLLAEFASKASKTVIN